MMMKKHKNLTQKDEWGQVKPGVPFQKYVSCGGCGGGGGVMCEVQTLEQMMDEKVTSDKLKEDEEENDDGGKSEPPGTLSVQEGTVRNYLIKFDVDENTVVRCTRFSRQ
jgi:hypothetical protein